LNNPKKFIIVFLCVFCVNFCFGFDFGLLLSENAIVEDPGSGAELTNTSTALPWFSSALGANADLYLSAAVTAKYEDKDWSLVPELYRSALDLRPGRGFSVSVGRIHYTDTLGFIASGLFDGAAFQAELGKNTFNIGAYYTGFIYKRTAHITMTKDDTADYDSPFSWNDMSSYFAPRRALAALEWSRTDTFIEDGTLTVGLLGQLDLTGTEYHSQYLTLRYGLPLGSLGEVEAAGTGELIENAGQIQASMAFLANGAWLVPGKLQDRLMFGFRWTSGKLNDTFAAFSPVSTLEQGRLLKAKLSGFMTAEAGYQIRFREQLSASLSVLYFLRTDRESFSDPELNMGNSPFLGGELNGELIWAPASDLSLTLGGGIFIPGPALNSGASPRWQVSLGIIFGL
jgi:hypothetical protein